MAYLHDLLLVKLPLLGQVIQLIHVLNQHRSQAVVGQSGARWILERISESGDDIRRVRRGAVSSHGKREETLQFSHATLTPTQRSGAGGKQRKVQKREYNIDNTTKKRLDKCKALRGIYKD